MKGLVTILAALALAMAFSSSAYAQQGGGNQGGGQGGRQRGNFDPAQMRERYMNELKTRLGSNDDEWKVLSPKLTKVMDAQRNYRSSRSFGGGRGGSRDNNNAQDQSPVAKASQDLRTAVENKDTPADELTKKMAAYREAREKARTEYQAAQKELKELLTARQEAVLLSAGMLE